MTESILVVSDLDGSLLDHETYRFDAALPALDRLRRWHIPLVLASSKTAAEIVPLRAALGFEHCEAIVENGAGLLEPGSASIDAVGASRGRLLGLLARMPGALREQFSGFSEWSLDETIQRTGLSAEAARAARQRSFSEPGLWRGDAAAFAAFSAALSEFGITATQGGRFLMLSFGADKAARMNEIRERYRSNAGEWPTTVALGDAPNDYDMLALADYGILIPNPALGHGREPPAGIRVAPAAGPEGWNRAVIELVDELQARSEPDK